MAKTVLITGSSSGIGRAAALHFQKQGWNVAATMRTPGKDTELAALDNVAEFALDVTDEESIRKAITDAIERFGDLDVVVNNAGYGLVGAFEQTSDEQIRRQFDTNVFGLMSVCRAVLPHFRGRRGGTIVNVASMGGRLTFPLYSLYHGTKWAVEGFTESLQHELKPFNVKVRIIEPGPIKTDFYGRSMDNPEPAPESDADDPYAEYVDRALGSMQASGANGAAPEVVAKVIYRAATSRTGRLRYPAGATGRMLLILRRLLPDGIFNGLVGRSIAR